MLGKSAQTVASHLNSENAFPQLCKKSLLYRKIQQQQAYLYSKQEGPDRDRVEGSRFHIFHYMLPKSNAMMNFEHTSRDQHV
ncbi:hypothetical protein MCEMIEM13_00747 [Comamonadaceae bacterium]